MTQRPNFLVLIMLGMSLVFWLACKKDTTPSALANQSPASELADIVSVSASGSAGVYNFSVGIASPDEGCEKYSDWWEVVDLDGNLLYRRILAHSHVNEQPFVRSGGPVAIAADQEVWVRAHMNPGGYGGITYRGSANTGFSAATPPDNFAAALENAQPLPSGCAF